MKSTLIKITLLVLLIVGITTHYSSAQIPNNDFELWNNMGLGGESPDQWFSSNGDLVPQNVFKDSLDKYSGNYSVLLTNVIGIQGSIGINFPITYHPFQLKGYFKSEFLTADSAHIKIILFNNTQAVDSGEYFITTTLSAWTQIAFTISNTTAIVNSATINIDACRQQQNKCWVDLLSLEEPNSVQTISNLSIQLFPNPASDKIFVSGIEINSTVKISDLNGRILSEIKNTEGVTAGINISNLPSGIYFLETKSNEKILRNYFVKN